MQGPLRPAEPGPGYRIRQGDFLIALVNNLWNNTTVNLAGWCRVLYDDGTEDDINIAVQQAGAGTNTIFLAQTPFLRAGWVVGFILFNQPGGTGTSFLSPSALFVSVMISTSRNVTYSSLRSCIAQGYLSSTEYLVLGQSQFMDFRSTWVFQGTVLEDATVGTHVCTLTVTPQAGSELLLSGGNIVEGNTVTSQTMNAYVTDGTNVLVELLESAADTTASTSRSFPLPGLRAANTIEALNGAYPIHISGTMQLVLKVTTAAVSVTQTFSVIARLKGLFMPSATLADALGTPTLTTNTNRVF